MRIARVAIGDGRPWYAQVDGEEVELLDDAPWLGGSPVGDVRPLTDVRLLAPVAPSKIVAIGRNYRRHIAAMGYDLPSEPSIFLKPPTALVGPDENVVLPAPAVSSRVEHEAEVALVIGVPARHLARSEALDHVAGITAADDVTARDLQRRDSYPIRAKGFDTFCPVGPWIDTARDLRSGVALRCRVNGRLRQSGNTDDLVFDLADILVRLTQFLTLLPGDVVLTGSPGGSGPLVDGDDVAVEIEGSGVLHHGVRAALTTDAADLDV